MSQQGQKVRIPREDEPALEIYWQDAQGDSTRMRLEEVPHVRLAVVRSVGWIVDENEERIVFAQNVYDTGEVDSLAIPRSNILRIVKRDEKKRKRKRKADTQPGSGERPSLRVSPGTVPSEGNPAG